ncbi:intraflagellar transport protein 46 homolog isoform X1 [Diabrotica virgifera virgifera]|uniref:Intraflagellar transport protein 46 homolog n=2 Tax=Diabrotica virgifera virgifera TaxID=50390 RepID=A0ABM5K738_DIAVI|nr:intraflagellar transport protein 46 homolog isoform X1 [Diabrotica virgifera virgifera]
MQRSFSIIDDDDDDEVFPSDGNKVKEHDDSKSAYKLDDSDLSLSEEQSMSPKRSEDFQKLKDLDLSPSQEEMEPLTQENFVTKNSGPPSLGNISGRQTAVLKRRTLADPKINRLLSDSDDSENDEKDNMTIPGEYDPKMYENLEVNDEIKELFKYISMYVPQQVNPTYKFKPFIPEFIPAVGDIDAFLKIYPPETTIDDEPCKEKFEHLGLTVLDEPASNQSDPAVLYLQLKAASGKAGRKNDENVVVKKIENIEKSAKTIDKWIKDISDLHKSKSSVVVRYSEPMPDLDDLMQEWPEEMEADLKKHGFPNPDNKSLQDYIKTVCDTFQIPLAKKKVQSLYLLFCLYGAIKQTQLYKTTSNGSDKITESKEADQLVLE